MTQLTHQRVHDIFGDSLYDEKELTPEQNMDALKGIPPKGAVRVEGIVNSTAFHPERLASHHAEIVELLHELPENFLSAKIGGGGGWSFLNMAVDKHGNQWAEHPTMDRLAQLAIGVDAGQYMGTREFWGLMPGGMPYFVVTEPLPEPVVEG